MTLCLRVQTAANIKLLYQQEQTFSTNIIVFIAVQCSSCSLQMSVKKDGPVITVVIVI